MSVSVSERIHMVCVCFILLLMGVEAMAVEEAKYRVLSRDGDIEIRLYEPQIVAEVVVGGPLEDAGTVAFRKLFNYISGENRSRAKIAMTAPVAQEPQQEKIAMTAPVSQESTEKGWAVSFMMPASYTMDTIPEPLDADVNIREIPSRTAAAIRYSGFWSEVRYQKFLGILRDWLAERKLTAIGEPIWARYNPPFMPWFLRRNEIMIPVAPPGE